MKDVFLSPHIPIPTLLPPKQKLLPVSRTLIDSSRQDTRTCTLLSPGTEAGRKAPIAHLHCCSPKPVLSPRAVCSTSELPVRTVRVASRYP